MEEKGANVMGLVPAAEMPGNLARRVLYPRGRQHWPVRAHVSLFRTAGQTAQRVSFSPLLSS